jgi:D-glycero-alpha-D-manno-heptose 1-phosphate guanylyltransferase
MDTICIVLAGGQGTRLRSEVPNLPKCLAPISGRPFLEWQLESLSVQGIRHFILALGYGSSEVLQFLRQPWARSLSISTVVESEPLGTGGAAYFAMVRSFLDEVLIANGDTFIGGSIQPMLEPLDVDAGELMRVATVTLTDRTRFGSVVIDSSNRVMALIEKGQADAGLVSAGLYRVHRRAFLGAAVTPLSLETQVMPTLIAKGGLWSRSLTGPFVDIGVPDDYKLFDTRVHEYIGTK